MLANGLPLATNTYQNMANMEEVLREIRRYNMYLNPEKCTFGVGGGKFLGFMITLWGI